MEKEIFVMRFLQISVSLLTVGLGYSIMQAVKGNIALHKKINAVILSILGVALTAFIGTVIYGFQYKAVPLDQTLLNIGPDAMGLRLNIHRCFSNPLFFLLIYTAWTGWKGKKAHKSIAKVTIFFWAGTLITALLFF